MEQFIQIIILILIGGIIGWTTNKLAIKMLFRPIKPIKFIFTFQGVLPKRKDEIAKSIAETIQREFLNEKEIISKLINSVDIDIIKDKLKKMLVVKFREILPPMVLAMFGGKIDVLVSKFIDSEGDGIFNDLMESFRNQGFERLNIAEIVKEKIDELDFIQFENLVYDVTKKELKHIEYIGLLLGLIIGVVQSVVILFT
ncbi:DUF445 family protein [Mycoplasmatota bacterium]|nr:DUF445 family protein [Mycoplasmatota bacterium]